MLSEIVFTLNKDEKLNQKLEKITNMIKKKILLKQHLILVYQIHQIMVVKLGWIKENVLNKKIKNELKNINNW